jgi:alkanesulfonate monooxygenase SsuD/methylene tetrahydromethanopterin reductase-like flavin-dependent oxidoreductase (luciferase family)
MTHPKIEVGMSFPVRDLERSVMHAGVLITGGSVADQMKLAHDAETAGWDGVFTWDGIHVGDATEVHDPWVLMSAFAVVTQRVRIGAIIQPLARRRPWKVAREAVTLDHVSNGRFVLIVGLGTLDDSGFGRVGEPTERRVRAEKLDEALEILTGLWSGEPFGFSRKHYQFEPMAFRPTPIQRPRIPIWVVGAWPSERSMARAARYDGLLPYVLAGPDVAADGLTPALLGQLRDWVAKRRDITQFDIIVDGKTPTDDAAQAAEIVQAWADAGATWWVESDWSTSDVDVQRHRILSGPPMVSAPGRPTV